MGAGKKMLLAFQNGGWDVGFPKEKKRYDKERSVLEFIVKNRKHGAISAIWQHYKDKLEIAEVKGGGDTMYFLDQREVVQHFYNKWAGQEDLVTLNDKLRVAEILMMQCNRDRTIVYVNKYTKSSEVLDNPVSLFYFTCVEIYNIVLTFYFIFNYTDV